MADKYEEYSRDELLRLLRERDRKPRFGLVWERDEIKHDRSLNDDFVVLEHDPALSVGDAPYSNILIEGDNFDALRYLRMTHAGKVQCIYIDPPYNTGNKDFIYNDRFVDKDDVYRHSMWLEYMYRRLLIAKELLAEDGVIFVSIDDNEMLHLGMLMERVFGVGNVIATIIWQKVFAVKNSAQHFSDDHEYILCFALNKDKWTPNPLPRTDAQLDAFSNPDSDPRGPWQSTAIAARNPYSAGVYSITCPSGRIIEGPPPGNYWRFSKEKFEELVRDNRIWWGKNGDISPRLKRFLSEVKQGIIPQTLWKHEEVGHTQEAKREIHDILQFEKTEEVFSTPKPVRLMERILRIATKPNDLVLDFFAGSGTTAHAVMKLNAEDGGNRRFILVSSTEATAEEPEKNVCRDVCSERLRRVALGYDTRKGDSVTALGGSFAYLRTKRIPASRVFNDIQHEQIWLALQLIHGDTMAPYDGSAVVQVSGNADARRVYVSKLDEAALEAVAKQATLGGAMTVYSWQPGLLRQRIEASNASFEKIPEFLVNRFGGGR